MACVALLGLALLVRVPQWFDRPLGAYSDNEDAASHVLVTIVAYDHVPVSEHHFVPLFTAGARHDLWIDDLPTASRMSARGYNYYTSWPPGFFVAAWAFHQALGMAPTPASLRGLNIALHYSSVALLFLLCFKLAKKYGGSAAGPELWAPPTVAALVYLAAPEALRSHLFSYWAEQLWQPIMLLQLLAFLVGTRWPSIVAIGLLGLCGTLIDWTAYVSNGGYFLAFVWLYWRKRDARSLWGALGIGLATLLGGGLLFIWFTSKVSLSELLAAQHYRAGVRTGGVLDYARLGLGYVLSLGPFLLLLVPVLMAARAQGARQIWARLPPGPFLFVAGFPVLENVLLANHASSYTYDRLKAVAFFGIVLAALLVAGVLPVRRLVAGSMLAAGLSIFSFWLVYSVYRPPTSPLLRQRKDLGALIRQTAHEDEIAFVNLQVRGHDVYYAGRNIVELDLEGQHGDAQGFIVPLLRRRQFSKGVFYRVDEHLSKVAILRYGVDGTVSETSASLPGS